MLSLLDSTLLLDSNPTNIIRSVLRNAADSISIILDWPPRQIKEPNPSRIKEPNPDGTNANAYKCYKSYKRSNIVCFHKVSYNLYRI